MPSRLGGLFDTYDFFGKSIPGVVWVTGILLLLPTDTPFLDSSVTLNIKNLAVFAIVGLAVGLVFGEVVHTLAINIERAFARLEKLTRETRQSSDIDEVGRAIKFISGVETSPKYESDAGLVKDIVSLAPDAGRTSQLLSLFGLLIIGISTSIGIFGLISGIVAAVALFSLIPIVTFLSQVSVGVRAREYLEKARDPYEGSSPPYVPLGFLSSLSHWISNRTSEIYEGLVPHRRLFKERVEPHYLPDSDRDEFGLKRLEKAINTEFDDPRDGDVQGNLADIYASINTKLQLIDARRADSFHSRYSFCRSMWVTLATFTIVYTLLYVHSRFPDIIDRLVQSEQTIQSPTGQAATAIAVLGLFLGTLAIGTVGQALIGKTGLLDSYRSRQGYLAAAVCYYGATIVAFGWSEALENAALWVGKETLSLATTAIRLISGSLNDTVLLLEQVLSTKIHTSQLVISQSVDPVFGPLIVSMAIATVVFFDAAGDYKDYYIQYLIVEFGEAVGVKEEYEISLN